VLLHRLSGLTRLDQFLTFMSCHVGDSILHVMQISYQLTRAELKFGWIKRWILDRFQHG